MRKPCRDCPTERLFAAEHCLDHLPDPTAWHRTALESLRQDGGHSANLTGARFPGVDFRGMTLEFANFSSAQLDGSDFRGVDLSRSSLANASAIEARFDGAQLQMVNARSASMRCAVFATAKLNGATLATTDLRAADFRAAELVGTNIRQARLSGANFEGARFLRASLSGADLTDAVFDGADLRDVAMIDVVGFDSIRRERTTGNSPMTTDVQKPGHQPPRPSEMRWRDWTEAEGPAWRKGDIG